MLLDDADIQRLRQMPPIAQCGHCGERLRQNYCRTHEEYFLDGHSGFCAAVLEWMYDPRDVFHLACDTYAKELGIRSDDVA